MVLEWLIFLILLAIIFGVGSQDETMAPIYANGLLTFRKTLLFGSVFAFLGVVLFSQKVGQTIGANLLGPSLIYTENMMLAVLLGVMAWILLATWTNVPVSITHSVLGAIFGIALMWPIVTNQPYIASMNWGNVGIILFGLLLSPIFGYLIAYLTQFAINRAIRHYGKGLTLVERAENHLRLWVLLFAALNAISRSGNDSGKVIGAAFSLLGLSGSLSSQTVVTLLIIGVVYAFGLYFVGWRLVMSVGIATGEQLRPSEALAIEISVSLILFVASFFGFPVSGTQVLVFALIGSARVRGEKPDPKTFRGILISWVLTIPISAGLSAFLFLVIPTV